MGTVRDGAAPSYEGAPFFLTLQALMEDSGDITPSATSGDERPNSGLREGHIPHSEVNGVLRQAEKAVIFGQQTRLRAGLLMKDDERLSRYHAGHEIVHFFYGAVRLIPEYLLDAIFERGISVTLVRNLDLLVQHGPRCHQSLHTGRTRKTIYIPEGVLMAAFDRNYDHWALSEVLIQEAWKLLDYYLVVELIRHFQRRMHTLRTRPGIFFIKDTLLQLNKHRRVAGEQERTLRHRFRRDSERGTRKRDNHHDEYDLTSTDTEFMQYYRHYHWDFWGWGRDMIERDPYEVAAEAYDEGREAAWAALKVNSIKHAFGYPGNYQVDRDIVHPVALAAAERRGQSLEPVNAEDIIHDLGDVSRFKVARQERTDRLLENLCQTGLDGIQALVAAVSAEEASGNPCITAVQHDGYDPVEVFRRMLEALSRTGPEGVPGSIGTDFRRYLTARLLQQVATEFERFQALSKRDRMESRGYLAALTLKALALVRPDLDVRERAAMVAPPARDFGPAYHVGKLAELAGDLLRRHHPESEDDLLFDMLRKLNHHPGYHDLILQQARELKDDPNLSWGDSLRDQVNDLRSLVPDEAYALSSDPAGVRARLAGFEQLWRREPDSEELLGCLAGILIRLDAAEGYEDMVERIAAIGQPAVTALTEVARQIGPKDERRQRIRQAASRALEQIRGPG